MENRPKRPGNGNHDRHERRDTRTPRPEGHDGGNESYRDQRPGQAPGRQDSRGPGRPDRGSDGRPSRGSDERGPGRGRPAFSQRKDDSLEGRLHQWLDILVWVWRRRTRGNHVEFHPAARLTDDELHSLANGVKVLSKGLTGTRDLVATSYMADPALLGAYLLFYWPLSFAQAWTVLQDPGLRLKGFDPACAALDLGSGPGPVAFALLEAGATSCLALESSPEALDLARELAVACDQIRKTPAGPEMLSRRLATRVWKAGDALPTLAELSRPAQGSMGNHGSALAAAYRTGTDRPAEKTWGLAAYGHLLNELPDLPSRLELTDKVSAAMGPGAVHLVLEPALRQTSRDLLALRDALLDPQMANRGTWAASQTGRPVMLGPCFFQGACPALKEADQTCHGAVHWEVPGLLQRLAHAARLGKEEPSMAWLVWRQQGIGGLGAEPPAKGVADDPRVRSQGLVACQGQVARPCSQGEGFPPSGEKLYRVTSEGMLNKAGFTRMMICGGEGAGEGLEGRMTLRFRREDMDGSGGTLRKSGRVFFGLKRSDVIRLDKPQRRDTGLGIEEGTLLDKM